MSLTFTTLHTAGIASDSAAPPAQFSMVDRVASVIFEGDVVAKASGTSPATQHTWVLRVVEVLLPQPTRRPFTVQAAISLHAMQGHALARITVDGQTTSRQIRSDSAPRTFDTSLRLAIRRSTYPRDRLRLLVWVEASSRVAGGEAQAGVDAIDIQAR